MQLLKADLGIATCSPTEFQRVGPARLVVILGTLGLFVTLSAREVSAQCDIQAALSEVNQLGCLSEDRVQVLNSYLGSETPGTSGAPVDDEGKRRLLKIAADAYQCLADRSIDFEKYRCFRQVLQERFYSRFKDDDLCLNDRLTRALARLGYALDKKLPVSEPFRDDQIIDSGFNDFRLGLGVSKQIKAHPGDFSSAYLSKTWCVNPEHPIPSFLFVGQVIDTSVRLAEQYPQPQLGKHVGSLLGSVLEDALAVYKGTEYEASLQEDYDNLIKFDNGDLSGTALYYLFERRLATLVSRTDVVRPPEIPDLLLKLEKLREQYLDEGARRLHYKARAWTPFERYSDLLYDLVKPFPFLPAHREIRRSLMDASCKALWRGIELSAGAEAEGNALRKLQEKLLDRIRAYGLELAFELRYPELVAFEGSFLDSTGKVLPESLQCYLHAHLAQASYVRGDPKAPWVHLEKSCELIDAAGLEQLRKSLEPWTRW